MAGPNDLPSEFGGDFSDYNQPDPEAAPGDVGDNSIFAGATEDSPPPPSGTFAGDTDIPQSTNDSSAWAQMGNLGGDLQPGALVPAAWNIGGQLFGGSSSGGGAGAGGQLPNLGVTPMPAPPGMRASSAAHARTSLIVRAASMAVGKHISAATIIAMILKFGFGAAAQLFQLGAQDLLYLFMVKKATRHHRRGPGLYTIAKRVRQAQRLQDMVRRVLGGGRGHHRRRAPYRTMGRHRRRRR